MDHKSISRNQALYQKSWTGWSCDHKNNQPQARSSLASQSKADGQVSKGHGTARHNSTNQMGSKDKTQKAHNVKVSTPKPKGAKSAMPMVTVSVDPLSFRRPKRGDRSRPWTEDVPKPSKRGDDLEMVYESCIPKGKRVEYKAREYVTNKRYGQLYEVRKERPRPQPQEPTNTWLWEEKFRLWRLDIDKNCKDTENKKRRGQGVSDVTRGQYLTSTKTKPADPLARPHADLFAAYHNETLVNQRRSLAASIIQQQARGWLVRQRIKRMTRQALMGLGRAWPKVTKEYRELVTRVQARHGVMKTSCPFSLAEMGDYLDKREKYERVFERVSTGEKLPRDQLSEFFKECGLFPTDGDITAAFNAVFRGSGSTAEVIFVLDCSTSLGIVSFHDQMTFVKDVVRYLDIGSDRVRVGVVPYNSDVFHAFGLLQYTSQEEIIQAVDQIKFRPGPTHTDIGLRIMRDMFKDARPGVQKFAIVVTNGQSANTQQTALEAKKAADENITVFAVGVGINVEMKELEEIARDVNRVYMCTDYRALIDLKHLVSSKLCLRACTLCQHTLPRVQLHGLYKTEALDILFTLYVLPATGLIPPSSPSHPTSSSDTADETEDGPAEEAKTEESDQVLEERIQSPVITNHSHANMQPRRTPRTKSRRDLNSDSIEKTRHVAGTRIEMSADLEKLLSDDVISALKGDNIETKKRTNSQITESTAKHNKSGGIDNGRVGKTLNDIIVDPNCRIGARRSMEGNRTESNIMGGSITADIHAIQEHTIAKEQVNIKSAEEDIKATSGLHNTNSNGTRPERKDHSKVLENTGGRGQESGPEQGGIRPMPSEAPTSFQMRQHFPDQGMNSFASLDTCSSPSDDVFLPDSACVADTSNEATTLTRNIDIEVQENDDSSSISIEDNATESTTRSDNTSERGIKVHHNRTDSTATAKIKDSDSNISIRNEDSDSNATSSTMDDITFVTDDEAHSPVLLLQSGDQDRYRPLTKSEALDIMWTLYPPSATRLPARRSRWIRPLVDGEEAWSLLDEKIIKATDFKVCLGLVVKARLEREGVVTIPSDVRAGVEEVTTHAEAMQKIEEYLEKRKKEGSHFPQLTA